MKRTACARRPGTGPILFGLLALLLALEAAGAQLAMRLPSAPSSGHEPMPGFASATDTRVGVAPFAVAVGDFNGDGRPDLAVANAGDASVSILLNGTAPGAAQASYRLAASPTVGQGAYSIAVGDFNGDGRPDLAVANAKDGTVTILINRTTPCAASASFHRAASPAVGRLPYAIAVGDFDGDGRPDLAVANFYGNTVSILVNDTAPGAESARFHVAASPAVGHLPSSLVVGDFDGDGRPDLAVANVYDSSVSILLNRAPKKSGAVRFELAASPAVGSGAYSLASGDFDGDGRPDLAVANAYDSSVSILLNRGEAGGAMRFEAGASPAVGSGAYAVAVGDFNGDGRPDLAVTSQHQNSVAILINEAGAGPGGTRFALAGCRPVGERPSAVAVGDFNGDGRPDLAIANLTGDRISTLLNRHPPPPAGGTVQTRRDGPPAEPAAVRTCADPAPLASPGRSNTRRSPAAS